MQPLSGRNAPLVGIPVTDPHAFGAAVDLPAAVPFVAVRSPGSTSDRVGVKARVDRGVELLAAFPTFVVVEAAVRHELVSHTNFQAE